MKCDCETCGGTGSITCCICAGSGGAEKSIERVDLDPKLENFVELRCLQSDALRVIKSAAELAKLKPDRKESYKEQLAATLKVINQQADRFNKNKTKP